MNFVSTGAFLYDVAGFSRKWLRDVAAGQWEDGTLSNMAPCPKHEGPFGPVGFLVGGSGAGEAIVLVPWELYRAYGDAEILRGSGRTCSAGATGFRTSRQP